MNCPGHCLMFKHRPRSYRELPWRVADFGVLHRNEFSGALSGLTRVRRFQQDDAHIFCRMDQIKQVGLPRNCFLRLMDNNEYGCFLLQEVAGVLDFINHVYGIFGFEFELDLATRPKKALGDLEVSVILRICLIKCLLTKLLSFWNLQLWNKAEFMMKDALDNFGKPWNILPGDGAFYGPKIDIKVFDALGRRHQCATLQLDFQLPIRFDLRYTTTEEHDLGEESSEKPQGEHFERPVIIHRAILGSVERFAAVLLEHTAGKWPFWLSPRQIMVLPVAHDQECFDYAEKVRKRLHDEGFQAYSDLSKKTYKKKIREATVFQYNFILSVGHQEVAEGTVNVRDREHQAGRSETTPLEDVVAKFKELKREYK